MAYACFKRDAILKASSGLNLVVQALDLNVSSITQNVLHRTSRACREVTNLPRELDQLTSIRSYASQVGNPLQTQPHTQQDISLSRAVFTKRPTTSELLERHANVENILLHSTHAELMSLQQWIVKPQHLRTWLITLKRCALASMNNKASAKEAWSLYISHAEACLEEQHAFCTPSTAMLGIYSLLDVSKHADNFGVKAPPAMYAAVHQLMDLLMEHQEETSSFVVCNVFWALHQLNLKPADFGPAYEAALARIFIATQHDSSLLGINNVLCAMIGLSINPLEGKLLESVAGMLERCLADPDLDAVYHVDKISNIIWALASLKLFIKPQLAKTLVTKIHQGIVQGADSPRTISTVLWACATMGFAPSEDMLHDFQESLARSNKQYNTHVRCTTAWALAVFGCLDLPYLKSLVGGLDPTTEVGVSEQRQIYQCLQALQPASQQGASYQEWLQLTTQVQQRWPLQQSTDQQSSYGSKICSLLRGLGYQVVEHMDSGDGLHEIDMALLPQKGIPYRVAVEADGTSHFLYEDYRLDSSPHPPSRVDGCTLFRNAVLRKQGWAVLSIPWHEWVQQPIGTANKLNYIANKLQELLCQGQKRQHSATYSPSRLPSQSS